MLRYILMYSETYSEAVVTIHSKDKQQLFFVMIEIFRR